MKYYSIVSFMLIIASARAQETPVKRNEYKSFGITYSTYAKPRASELYNTTFLLNENTFTNLRHNIGVSIQYSQMNFIKDFGIEFGIGAELLLTSNDFSFSFPSTFPENHPLSSSRSHVALLNIPLHYVHRFELGKGFTIFPKFGVDAKILLHGQTMSSGTYTDSLNNLNYSVGYTTSNRQSELPFETVFLNGTIGASLAYTTKKGAMFGIHFAFGIQLLKNTLLTRINRITYKRNGQVSFDSKQLYGDYYYTDEDGNQQYYPGKPAKDFLAENRMTNFSIGVSYLFGK